MTRNRPYVTEMRGEFTEWCRLSISMHLENVWITLSLRASTTADDYLTQCYILTKQNRTKSWNLKGLLFIFHDRVTAIVTTPILCGPLALCTAWFILLHCDPQAIQFVSWIFTAYPNNCAIYRNPGIIIQWKCQHFHQQINPWFCMCPSLNYTIWRTCKVITLMEGI